MKPKSNGHSGELLMLKENSSLLGCAFLVGAYFVGIFTGIILALVIQFLLK